MLVTCWSVKGGSGTTVVAVALAVLLSRRVDGGALCLDVGGDVPTMLGLPEPTGPGLLAWFGEPTADRDALRRLEVVAGGSLALVPRGPSSAIEPVPPIAAGPAAERLLAAASGRPTVIDAGPPSELAFALAASSALSLLVLRPCYLALRHALAARCRPSAVVLVEEPRRSLDAGDVEEVLGVPVCAVVPWDASIARSVDAGLLGARLPRPLASALRSAA